MRGETGGADPDSKSRNRSGEGDPDTGDPVRNDDAVNKERPPKSWDFGGLKYGRVCWAVDRVIQ